MYFSSSPTHTLNKIFKDTFGSIEHIENLFEIKWVNDDGDCW